MYTPLQLDIIREFGSKELTEGCLYITDTYTCTVRHDDKCTDGEDALILYSERYDDSYVIDEILGHIPHLEDVFRVAEEQGRELDIEYRHDRGFECYTLGIEKSEKKNNWNVILYNPTLPLLEQSEETLTQLLILLGK